MHELTPQSPIDAQRHDLARLARAFTDNIRELEAALQDNSLGELAHRLSQGASIPRERQGKVVGRALMAACTEIALRLGELDGAEGQAKHDVHAADLAERRDKALGRMQRAVRPIVTIEPPLGDREEE